MFVRVRPIGKVTFTVEIYQMLNSYVTASLTGEFCSFFLYLYSFMVDHFEYINIYYLPKHNLNTKKDLINPWVDLVQWGTKSFPYSLENYKNLKNNKRSISPCIFEITIRFKSILLAYIKKYFTSIQIEFFFKLVWNLMSCIVILWSIEN